MYSGVHNGVSTVNKENINLLFLYFGRNLKNILGGQDHQKGFPLLHTYGQLIKTFGYGGVVVRMRAHFPIIV